jgi:indolepyruvate ferredoxin oxidoreductase alpha subunit
LAARDAGVTLGTGYPGTPSTEILEAFSAIGGKAQWAPNEKVALEVGLGAAFGGARALVTMKHVGVNVAADPLFTIAYTGVSGGLVLISADDPGMHSSQNEQDNRNFARAAGVPMLEPADAQETYDFFRAALEISQRWGTLVLLRMTTRVCHSKGIVTPWSEPAAPSRPHFERDIASRLMLPGNARPAHHKLRAKLHDILQWNEKSPLNREYPGGKELGIITSGVSALHVLEGIPAASVLKLGMAYPFPAERVRRFREKVDRCVVIEEGDPYLVENCRFAGIDVEDKAEMYRFGEFNVDRVRRIVNNDTSPETPEPPGKPPQLCADCPHRTVFRALSNLDCIVSGDIGCYTLGGRPPFSAMDTCVCMGASIGVGLGLRHVLPKEEALRVISVIGDSTFMHSGITGLVEMVYNPPPTGHVVLIVDNGTTAMTGLQEHPGTGRHLDHTPGAQILIEDIARSLGIPQIHVTDPTADWAGFEKLVADSLASRALVCIIARKPCALAAPKIEAYECAACAEAAP